MGLDYLSETPFHGVSRAQEPESCFLLSRAEDLRWLLMGGHASSLFIPKTPSKQMVTPAAKCLLAANFGRFHEPQCP